MRRIIQRSNRFLTNKHMGGTIAASKDMTVSLVLAELQTMIEKH
jgi:hypothetical protein